MPKKVKFCTECIQPYGNGHSCPTEDEIHYCILCNLYYRNFWEFAIHCSYGHTITPGNLPLMLILLKEHIPIDPNTGEQDITIWEHSNMLKRVAGQTIAAAAQNVSQIEIHSIPEPEDLVLCATCLQKIDETPHICTNQKEPHICPICKYFNELNDIYTTRFNMLRHMKSAHNANDHHIEYAIQCLVQNMRFSRVDETLIYSCKPPIRNRKNMRFCIECSQELRENHVCFRESICFVCDCQMSHIGRMNEYILHMSKHNSMVIDIKTYMEFIDMCARIKGYEKTDKYYRLMPPQLINICGTCYQLRNKGHRCESVKLSCIICDRVFDNLNMLIEHMLIHPEMHNSGHPVKNRIDLSKFNII